MSDDAPPPSTRTWRRVILGAVLLTAGSLLIGPAACDRAHTKDFLLVYSGSIQGALEEIGGRSSAPGGMARRATVLDSLTQSETPAIVVDSGNLLFASLSPPEYLNEQRDLKAHYLARAMVTAGIDAQNIGPLDLANGLTFLQEVVQATGLPVISSNLIATATNAYAFPRFVVTEVSDVRVGIVGLTAPPPAQDGVARDYTVAAPTSALRTSVRELYEAEDVDLVILLSSLSDAQTRTIVNAVPGVTFVVEQTHPSGTLAPPRVGTTHVFAPRPLQAALHTVSVSVYRGSVDFVDRSARQAQGDTRARIAAQRRILSGRIAKREEAQEILAQLDKNGGAMSSGDEGETPDRSTIQLRVTPLDSSIPPHPRMRALISEYKRSLFDLPDEEPPHPIPHTPEATRAMLKTRFVGGERCASCHVTQATFQDSTVHHQAFESLVQKGSQRDRECLRCHATGFTRENGFMSVEAGRERNLLGVSCEACHGPGGLHVVAETRKTKRATIQRTVPEQTCVQCHDGVRYSDPVDYTRELPLVACPAGGEPPLH